MQFVYEYYRIEKQEIFCMLSMLRFILPLCQYLAAYCKSLFSPRCPQPLFRNSVVSCFWPMAL